jgi:hypothetical protein
MKNLTVLLTAALLLSASLSAPSAKAAEGTPGRPTIAAYYFPNCHVDPRN